LLVLRENTFEASVSHWPFKKWIIAPRSLIRFPARLRAAGGIVEGENRSLTHSHPLNRLSFSFLRAVMRPSLSRPRFPTFWSCASRIYRQHIFDDIKCMIENVMKRVFGDAIPITFVQIKNNAQIVQVVGKLFQRFIGIIGNLFRYAPLDSSLELTWHWDLCFLYSFF